MLKKNLHLKQINFFYKEIVMLKFKWQIMKNNALLMKSQTTTTIKWQNSEYENILNRVIENYAAANWEMKDKI